MARSPEKKLFRVVFYNQGKVFEIYARNVQNGGLFGFVEVEDLVFGEKSKVIVDPTENALRQEFEDTTRFFVPLHAVIRIDEVEKDSKLKPRVVPLDPAKHGGNGAPSGEGSERNFTPIYTPPNPFGGK